MDYPRESHTGRPIFQSLKALAGTAGMTLTFFLVLPLIQAISKPPTDDLLLTGVDTAHLPPPPPPPPEPEQEEEKPPERQPPQLAEEAPPLDLSQLELALQVGGGGGGWMTGDFGIKLQAIASPRQESEALFSLADLDQKPRVIYQPSPVLDTALRQRCPGAVQVLFIVDTNGKVQSPIVQGSTDPAFESPTLAAVKKWTFEPGKRQGRAVRFRMRVPITFPARGANP